MGGLEGFYAAVCVPCDPWGLGGGFLEGEVRSTEDAVLCCEGSRESEESHRLKKWGGSGSRTGWRTKVVLGLRTTDIVHQALGTMDA